MEETMSVFWVERGYRLRSRKSVHCRVPMGWLVPHLVPVLVPVILYYTCFIFCYTCYLTT